MTYRALLAVPGLKRAAGATGLARVSAAIWAVVIVVFTLRWFNSPPLAGAVVLAGMLPGLVLSPVVGVLLDRRPSVRLLALDYAVGGASNALIALLAATNTLSPALLLVIVAMASITLALGWSGSRSILPNRIPANLWEQLNSLDSASYSISVVIGPAIGGTVATFGRGSVGLIVVAVVSLSAAALMYSARLPANATPSAPSHLSVFHDAFTSLRLVVWENRSLRGITALTIGLNVALGTLTVAIPVIVVTTLHQTAIIGVLWAIAGAAAVGSALVMGRRGMRGAERTLMFADGIAYATACFAAAISPIVIILAAGMLLSGLAEGAGDVALMTLRQRRVDPQTFGRIITTSASVNRIGMPLGAALAGVLSATSVRLALAVGGLLTLVITATGYFVIPRDVAETSAS